MSTDAEVVAWVGHDFGLRLTSLAAVPHGADRRAQVWRGTADDGSSSAIKLTSGGAGEESVAGLLLTRHLAGSGVPGVPEPLAAADGRPWSERPGGTAVGGHLGRGGTGGGRRADPG